MKRPRPRAQRGEIGLVRLASGYWAIRWGREAFGIEQKFLRVDTMKFQRIVVPDTLLDLGLDWQPHCGALAFRFDSEHGVHAGGRVLFAAAAARP